MIFNEFLITYFGWCPKFNVPLVESKKTPIINLSSIRKATLVIFLILLGLDDLRYFNSDLSNLSYLYNLVALPFGIQYNPHIILSILQILLPLIFGVTLIIIAIDFSLSKNIIKRHRIELAILFSSQALITIVTLIINFPKGDWAYLLFASTIFAILLFYISYRLLKNKRILNRTTFMILGIFFIEETVRELIFYPWNLLYTDQVWMHLALIVEWEIICVAAAYFCFKVYKDLRKNDSFTLSFPWYVRSIAVVYALSGLRIDRFLFTGNFDLYRIPSDGFFIYILHYAKYVGLIAVAFLPLTFNVGGGINNSLEAKGEVP